MKTIFGPEIYEQQKQPRYKYKIIKAQESTKTFKFPSLYCDEDYCYHTKLNKQIKVLQG